MRKAPSKESRPPPPTVPMTYGELTQPGGGGDGRYSITGPYGYPGPQAYLPAGPTTAHGHGQLRYVREEDDRDDAMSIDGESYASSSYARERASSSTSRAQGGGGYYGAGPLPPSGPPVSSYDSRQHYHYQQPSPLHHAHTYAGRSSYDQQYYHHHRSATSATYDERDHRDRDRDPPRDYFLRPRSPGSPGCSPCEDGRDVDGDEGDDFDKDKHKDNDMQSSSQSSLNVASPPPPPPPHTHYRSSLRREEDSAASSSLASSSSSAARYYGVGELKWTRMAPGMGVSSSRSAARGRSMSMSLALPPPPPLFPDENPSRSGIAGGGNIRSIGSVGSESGSEMTPPGPILTPISTSSANRGFPPNLHQPHQQFQHHNQHAPQSSSPRREREREGERDPERYYGSYASHHNYAHAATSGNGGNPYYTPASMHTTASSTSCGSASVSSMRTGAGNSDRNGDMQEYFPFVPVATPSSVVGPSAAATQSSTSSPVIIGAVLASAKEASYPSPPPERGSGSGSGSGSSSQRERERVPSIGSLTSGNGNGNGSGGSGSGSGSGMYRSAEDQKALGAFRVAL
jgi:hypothetical protein